MKVVNNQPRREPTPEEKVIELEYKNKKLTLLLGILSAHLGNEKVLYLAKMGNYPKTDEQITELMESKIISEDDLHTIKFAYARLIKRGVVSGEDYMQKLKSIFE